MGTQDSICSRSDFSATTLLHVRFYEHVNSSAARDSFYGLQSGHTLILTVCVRSHFFSSTIAQSVAMSPLVFPAFLFSFGDTYCLQFFSLILLLSPSRFADERLEKLIVFFSMAKAVLAIDIAQPDLQRLVFGRDF